MVEGTTAFAHCNRVLTISLSYYATKHNTMKFQSKSGKNYGNLF